MSLLLSVSAVDPPATASKSIWEIVIPVFAALVALVGTLITLMQKWRSDRATLRQKMDSDKEAHELQRKADKREAWWKRTQWAMDQALAATDAQAVAVCLAVLQRVGLSDLADRRDGEMLFAVATQIQAKWGGTV